MYKLEFLPTAKNDMQEIITYIANELDNKSAAYTLAEEFIKSAEGVCEFPYSNSVYSPVKPLKYEYRRIIVKNYLMFYTVNESRKPLRLCV